jgi:regulator of sigma E protease
MTTAFAFLIAIAVLVAIHEWGHYAVAVACGVRVIKFSIGFGPRLWGWTSKKSGTEFAISLLPLGGYVRMLDEREGEVRPEERHKAFNTQPIKKRAAIVAAGPVANLLFAVLLYAWVFWTGMEEPRAVVSRPVEGSVAASAGFSGGELIRSAGFDSDELSPVQSFDDLRWWLTRAALDHRKLQLEFERRGASHTDAVSLDFSGVDVREADASLFRTIGFLAPYSPPVIGDLSPGGAAAEAGIHSGDLVLEVDQKPIVDSSQLRDLIRKSGANGEAQAQSWLVSREGSYLVIPVAPRLVSEGAVTIGRVGAMIGAPPTTTLVRYGPTVSVVRAFQRTWEVSALTLKMMGQILTGNASLKNLSGPITIADYAGKSAAMGLTQYLVFLALISVSLGVLNLLPLPVLDGGHLMYYLWEMLTGNPVSDTWMERLQRVGVAMLLMMMSVAVFNDVTRLLG